MEQYKVWHERSARESAATKSYQPSGITKYFRNAGTALSTAVAAITLGLGACSTASAAPPKPAVTVGTTAACPWLNARLPISERVEMLMHKMTVADEIAIVEGHGWHQYAGRVPENTALCMPALTLEDGPNGVGDGLKDVTNLPAGTALAATFSPRLAYEYGKVIGAEQAAKGSAVDLGPTVNIDRDPRWGREFESLSEDPTLAAKIDVAEIRGIQSQGTMAQVKHFDAYNQETYRNTPKDGVVVSRRALHEIYMPAFRAAIRKAKVSSIMCSYATVNGYYSCENRYLLTNVLRDEWNFNGFNTSDWGAVHNVSAAAAGTDIQEPGNKYFGPELQKAITNGTISRAVLNTMVERVLYQMFRFHFFDHPPTGSITAMATTPEHQETSNRIAELGTVLLKNEGHLLPLSKSAEIAVIGPAASAEVSYGGGGSAHVVPSSTVTPLAGLQAVAGTSNVSYTQGLPTDKELTQIPAADLSDSSTAAKKKGKYSATLTPPDTGTYILGLGAGCNHWFTRLSVNGKVVINAPGSPHSAAIHLNKGEAYHLTASCPAAKLTWATPATVRSGIQKAVAAAKSAKIVVVVVADDTESEGGDRPDLQLPSAQNALVMAVAKANPHTVVVIQAGAPIAMPWLEDVPAILDTWYPGQTDGTALANVLFGKVDPSGHLPVTFPVKLADVPAASPERFPGVDGTVHYSEGLLVGYRWYDAKYIQPMFPFGFGLSYTKFQYSDLHLSAHEVNGTTPVWVSARVTNVGHVKGTDVAQLYLGMPASTGEPPRKLVGFQRVTLAPGQSKVVHFAITPRNEWWWKNNGWTETAGSYHVYAGDSSAMANLPLTASYTVKDTIGDRQVTVTAPKTFKPGTRTIVHVSLSAGGNETLHNIRLSLQAPSGWQVAEVSHKTAGKVAPDKGITEEFAVTPPSKAVTQFVTLYGTADLSNGACKGDDAHHGNGMRAHHRGAWSGAKGCAVRRDGGTTVLLGS